MTARAELRRTAAEYVIGTLDAEERAAFRARMAEDSEAAALAALWSRRFAPLHELSAAAAPPEGLFEDILALLPTPEVPDAAAAPSSQEGIPAAPDLPGTDAASLLISPTLLDGDQVVTVGPDEPSPPPTADRAPDSVDDAASRAGPSAEAAPMDAGLAAAPIGAVPPDIGAAEEGAPQDIADHGSGSVRPTEPAPAAPPALSPSAISAPSVEGEGPDFELANVTGQAPGDGSERETEAQNAPGIDGSGTLELHAPVTGAMQSETNVSVSAGSTADGSDGLQSHLGVPSEEAVAGEPAEHTVVAAPDADEELLAAPGGACDISAAGVDVAAQDDAAAPTPAPLPDTAPSEPAKESVPSDAPNDHANPLDAATEDAAQGDRLTEGGAAAFEAAQGGPPAIQPAKDEAPDGASRADLPTGGEASALDTPPRAVQTGEDENTETHSQGELQSGAALGPDALGAPQTPLPQPRITEGALQGDLHTGGALNDEASEGATPSEGRADELVEGVGVENGRADATFTAGPAGRDAAGERPSSEPAPANGESEAAAGAVRSGPDAMASPLAGAGQEPPSADRPHFWQRLSGVLMLILLLGSAGVFYREFHRPAPAPAAPATPAPEAAEPEPPAAAAPAASPAAPTEAAADAAPDAFAVLSEQPVAAILLAFDADTGTVDVLKLPGTPAPGHHYTLWLTTEMGGTQRLGTFTEPGRITSDLLRGLSANSFSTAHLQVTDEEDGADPAAPPGPPLFSTRPGPQ